MGPQSAVRKCLRVDQGYLLFCIQMSERRLNCMKHYEIVVDVYETSTSLQNVSLKTVALSESKEKRIGGSHSE
jgi:hypothetical protein